MGSTFFGNTLQKTCPLSALSYLCNKTLKRMQSILYENKITTKKFIRTKLQNV